MGFLDKIIKKDVSKESKQSGKIFILTDEVGSIEPFTILVSEQFNNFISILSTPKYIGTEPYLRPNEMKAFDYLWSAACPDIDGFGNNIWNLKLGTFEIYNNEGVRVLYQKKESQVKDSYTQQGRADFYYLSADGNIVFHQDDRNKKAFLVYVSDNASPRLLQALRKAEAAALDVQLGDSISSERTGIPDTINIPKIKEDNTTKLISIAEQEEKLDKSTSSQISDSTPISGVKGDATSLVDDSDKSFETINEYGFYEEFEDPGKGR